jgi:hypothetical protein
MCGSPLLKLRFRRSLMVATLRADDSLRLNLVVGDGQPGREAGGWFRLSGLEQAKINVSQKLETEFGAFRIGG